MNDDNENVLIIAYNLFCTILIPAVIVLTGIWSLESESDFTHGRTGGLPMGGIDCIRSRGYIWFEVENEKGVYNFMLYCVVYLPS